MTPTHDWLLLDIGTHPYQTVDDLTALQRYAQATDRPHLAALIDRLAQELTQGSHRIKIKKPAAAELAATAIERCYAIQALLHEGYIVMQPDPTAAPRVALHATGKAELLLQQAQANRCPHPASADAEPR